MKGQESMKMRFNSIEEYNNEIYYLSNQIRCAKSPKRKKDLYKYMNRLIKERANIDVENNNPFNRLSRQCK